VVRDTDGDQIPLVLKNFGQAVLLGMVRTLFSPPSFAMAIVVAILWVFLAALRP
jgi:hypothetical protein